MIRVACLGNSHFAAFKLGWENIKGSYPDIEMTFFGAVASAMQNLKVDGGRLVPTAPVTRDQIIGTSGRDDIPGDFDAYLLVGMGMGIVHLVNMMSKHRPARLMPAGGGFHLVSDSLVNEVRRHLLDNCASVRNVERIRQINSSAPIYVAPNPFPTADVLRKPEYGCWAEENVLRDCQVYFDQVIPKKIPGALYVPQPAATLVSRYLTKVEFARNTVVIRGQRSRPASEGEVFHLNADYGTVFLSAILSSIAPERVLDSARSRSSTGALVCDVSL
jgi:hypothetical protein